MVERIERVRAAVIMHRLPVPVHFGEWVMRHREFIVVRVDTDSGISGFSYGLTRDGPVAEIIRRSIAPVYEGAVLDDPAAIFSTALWSNHAVHAAGVGTRALSLVDIATWDALARSRNQSLTELMGGQPTALPVTAIIGYPPDIPPEAVTEQIQTLSAAGWNRFKLPISSDLDLSVARLKAARAAAPEGWVGFDINMVFRNPQAVLEFERRVRDLQLGWIEDVVPPGDAEMVAQVRKGSQTPIAMGDEQGGSYYPEALIRANAVDIVRIDATTNGGITNVRGVIGRAADAGLAIAPHMFGHVHARVLAGLGISDVPIEWGIPGTGILAIEDGLEQPVVVDGMMAPLAETVGLGAIIDTEWLAEQELDDPDGATSGVPSDAAR